MDERLERRQKRLAAMSTASPGIEAEAVYFMASSLVRSAVESAVKAEAEILVAAVAESVTKALPKTVIDLGDGRTEYPIKIRLDEVAEDLEGRAYEYVLLGIAEELIKSEGENT